MGAIEKKILLAVDDSIHSRQALAYAARMRQVIPGLSLALFHSQPAVSQFLVDEARRHGTARAELNRVMARNAEAARALLDRSRELLVRAGVPEAAVESVSQPRQQGPAKDILDLAQHGLYDAVVVGRRGLGSLQRMVMGSVSVHLVENSQLIPVWLVDGEVCSERILAAVDGSAGALRAVDHLAFMLSGNPEAVVRFFHVTPRLRDFCEVDFSEPEARSLEALVADGDRRCMDDFFAAAMGKLKAAGFAERQIETRTASALIGVGETILEAARAEGFGTIVTGRRGANRSFFGGSVSHTVSRNIVDAAMWMVP
jgi:nucleotide-binding universal stress UspA family protein